MTKFEILKYALVDMFSCHYVLLQTKKSSTFTSKELTLKLVRQNVFEEFYVKQSMPRAGCDLFDHQQ